MKNKKILSLLTAGMMLGSLMIPAASAVDISVKGPGVGSEYSAFRILNLTTSLKGDHVEHEGAHQNDCYNYAYTVNPKYADILLAAASAADTDSDGTISDEEINAYLGAMANDGEDIRAFADAVFANLGDTAADADAVDGKFTGVDQGYYLITEKKAGAAPDSVSLVMLNTAGQDNIEVTSKEGVPTLVKKIVKADGTLSDTDSVAYGDEVNYRLTATMPSNIDAYESYRMVFHDKINEKLTLKADSIKVTVGTTELTAEQFTVPETKADGCALEVVITDVKALATVAADTTVVVEYTCTVADTATLGATGNENVAHLEFSNDPYDQAEGKVSSTPDDQVKVFTFGLKVTKTDEATNAPLAGADFKLMKKGTDGEYADYKVSGAAEGATEFNFNGLDEGEYKLVETKVPAGYVKAKDVEFTVTAEMTAENEVPALQGLTVVSPEDTEEKKVATADVTSGLISTTVVNVAGFRLPITGGQGTYAIYAGGALLVVAAGAAVYMKKRKPSAETDAE